MGYDLQDVAVAMYLFGAGFVLALLVSKTDSHAGVRATMAFLPKAPCPVASSVVAHAQLVSQA